MTRICWWYKATIISWDNSQGQAVQEVLYFSSLTLNMKELQSCEITVTAYQLTTSNIPQTHIFSNTTMKTSNLTQEFYSLSSESVFLTHAQIPHKHSKKNTMYLFYFFLKMQNCLQECIIESRSKNYGSIWCVVNNLEFQSLKANIYYSPSHLNTIFLNAGHTLFPKILHLKTVVNDFHDDL